MIYSPVKTFPSQTSSKDYTVSVDSEGNLSCTCRAWVYKKGPARTCTHVRQVEHEAAMGDITLPVPLAVQAAASEKGGSLTAMFRQIEKEN